MRSRSGKFQNRDTQKKSPLPSRYLKHGVPASNKRHTLGQQCLPQHTRNPQKKNTRTTFGKKLFMVGASTVFHRALVRTKKQTPTAHTNDNFPSVISHPSWPASQIIRSHLVAGESAGGGGGVVLLARLVVEDAHNHQGVGAREARAPLGLFSVADRRVNQNKRGGPSTPSARPPADPSSRREFG